MTLLNIPYTEAEVDDLRETCETLQTQANILRRESMAASQRLRKADAAWHAAYDAWKNADPYDKYGTH